MKNLNYCYKTYEKRARLIFLFCFFLYAFLGMCITYPKGGFGYDLIFGADCARAYMDMVTIRGFFHSRISVHPLFLVLIQPLVLLLKGITNHSSAAIIFLQAAAAALSISVFDGTLREKNVEKQIRNCITCIYTFCFGMLIFSAVPETFIFACLGLNSFCYFLVVAAKESGPFTLQELICLIFFGVATFGITLTNYMVYLLGLVYLIGCRYFGTGLKGDKRNCVLFFVKANFLTAISVVAGHLFQHFVWIETPFFWTGIVNGFLGKGYEEMRYTNWDFTYAKTVEWIKFTLFRPILSPELYIFYPKPEEPWIFFNHYSLFCKILLVLFYLLIGSGIVLWFLHIFRKFNWADDGYIIFLLSVFVYNLTLHYVYGSWESFIYSPHYTLYILLAGALVMDKIASEKIKKCYGGALGIFCIVETINNLTCFFETAEMALGTVGLTVDFMKALVGVIPHGTLLFSSVFVLRHLIRPKTESYTARLCSVLKIYGVLTLAVCLFISLSYR